MQYRHRRTAVTWMAGIVLFLSGCGNLSDPVSLLDKPAIPPESRELYQAVSQFTPPDAKWIVPSVPKSGGAIQQVDIDGDGQKEIIAFFKEKPGDYEIIALILKRKGQDWALWETIQGIGDSLEYAGFHDLSGNGKPELVFGFGSESSSQREIIIYSLDRGRMKRILKEPYTELAVDYLIRDTKQELVLFKHDRDHMKAEAQWFTFKNGQLRLEDSLKLNGSINRYSQVLTGETGKSKRGIFLDMDIGVHSAQTDLILLEKRRLKSVWGDMEGKPPTFKPYSVPSEDVNGDGVIEIPTQLQPKGTEKLPMPEVPWITIWNQWDGKNGLKSITREYRDQESGFSFQFPASWSKDITIGTEAKNGRQETTFYFLSKEQRSSLITVRHYRKTDGATVISQLQDEGADYVLLEEEGDQVWVGVLPRKMPSLSSEMMKQYNKKKLNHKEIRQLFQTIHQDR